jgi:hypothetical protein
MFTGKKVRLSDAAEICGLDVGQIRNWIQRKQIILGAPEFTPAEERGSYHTVTWRGVLRLAITARLAALGLPIDTANVAALKFVDSSVDEVGGRKPGFLYPTGDTLLVISPNTNENFVLWLPRDKAIFELEVLCKSNPTIVLPLNSIVKHVEQEFAKL